MNSELIEKQYGYLWNDPNDRWVLVGKDGRFSILQGSTHDMLIIENDELDELAINRMISEGCEQFETIWDLEAKHPISPES